MSATSAISPSPCRIAAVCGSLQAHSTNRELLDIARATAPASVQITQFDGLRALPLFDPDIESELEPVRAWRAAVAAADAILIACPEYGFSLPGALKNAIDWLIGSGELEGKIVGITAAVKIEGRGRRGLEALADTLRALSVRIIGGTSIVRGPQFEQDIAALIAAIEREVREPRPAPEHGFGPLRPSALVSEWIAAFNRADTDALTRLYSNDAVSEGVGKGRAAIRDFFTERFAEEKVQRSVEGIFEDGDWAILEWRDAEGRRGCSLFCVKRGEIERERGY